jgi:hypothetical protein
MEMDASRKPQWYAFTHLERSEHDLLGVAELNGKDVLLLVDLLVGNSELVAHNGWECG